MSARRATCPVPAKARGQAGFTLIELLVALTLFGLLSLALMGGLGFGTRVWESGQARSAAFAETSAVHDFLRGRLVLARLPLSAVPDADEGLAFLGSAEAVRFIAPLPDYVGLGGLYRFELSTERDFDRRDLVVTWRLHRPDEEDPSDEDTSRRVLLEGIEDLEIRYFGVVEPDEVPDWYLTWEGENSLPLLVELTLSFPPGDRRTWPRLAAAPMASAEP